ncbi:PLP-dependent aminotransferase family protein [Variovorax sp.]|uniref:MocR-like pyridoxine biosynthesis transcription factor PdxR n=1 Tax=Variovorax sp. TaxID=1871043 RepID=UPI002D69E9E6|nr:PLP-dependent aminotransferase family protein [Variovorax sp.]HYP85462.1 PLP-dependent aminotransferase family protein [Variovorax sp.]
MSQRLSAAMWTQLMQRSSRPNLSLQSQIREMMVTAILDGQLPSGVPLPSSRDLAEHLGVARNTVVLAYQQLAEEGYLISRQRSGHFVNPEMTPGNGAVRRGPAPPARPPGPDRPVDWAGRLRLEPAAQRSIVKPADWQSYPYPFLYGQLDASLFPIADWREVCMKSLGVLDIREWAPDRITLDDDSLVQQIRTRVLPRRGVWASADELIVTVGAQHALYMLADLLMRENTRVAIEDPGYPDARNIFASRSSHVVPLAVDADGLPVDERLAGFDYVYATPSHQCPTGVTMPLARREALLAMANDSDLVIIEDDFESENRFNGDPIPALKSLDQNNRVIYVGSLSKSLAPGLRLGYIVGAPPLIAQLRALRRLMLRHPTAFTQRAFALFLSLGHHDAQLRRLAMAQRERSAVLLQALAQYAPACQVTPTSGGGSMWVRLPDGVSAVELAERAMERGVLIEPGDVFFASDTAPGGYLRLGYQAIEARSIEAGVKELAAALEGLMPRS